MFSMTSLQFSEISRESPALTSASSKPGTSASLAQWAIWERGLLPPNSTIIHSTYLIILIKASPVYNFSLICSNLILNYSNLVLKWPQLKFKEELRKCHCFEKILIKLFCVETAHTLEINRDFNHCLR